jgi:hypothetical protein
MKKQWKNVMLLSTALCVAAGCNKDGNDPEAPGESLVPSLRDVQQPEGVVGRGYDLTGKYADASWVKAPVLNYNALAAAELIDHPNGTETDYKSSSGTNVNQYQESLANGIGGVLGILDKLLFGGAVNSIFSPQQITTNMYAFGTYSARVPKRSTRVLFTTGSILLPYRSTLFLQHLKTLTAAQLVENYGTHVMLGAIWGGRCDYNMSSQKKAGQPQASIANYCMQSAMHGLFDENAEAPAVSGTAEAFETSTTSASVHIVGGDVSLGAAINANAGYTKYTEWVRTIQGDNIQWIDFYPAGLVLLADFVEEHPADGGLTKAQVKAAIQTYCESKGLSYDPTATTNFIEANANAILTPNFDKHGGLVQENTKGDADVYSKGGGYTDWEVFITITGRHTKQMTGTVQYRVKESGGIATNASHTQLLGTYSFTINLEHDIEHFGSTAGFTLSSDGNSVSLHGSGTIYGNNHNWNTVSVSGLTSVEVKIDGTTSHDENDCGIRFGISVPYVYNVN